MFAGKAFYISASFTVTKLHPALQPRIGTLPVLLSKSGSPDLLIV
jgi:hypothetical protein